MTPNYPLCTVNIGATELLTGRLMATIPAAEGRTAVCIVDLDVPFKLADNCYWTTIAAPSHLVKTVEESTE